MRKSNNLKIDKILLFTIIILSLFGILMVYSASNVVSLYKFNDSFYYVKRQCLFLIISYIIMYLIIKKDIRNLYKYTTYIFMFCFFLLLIVLIPFIGVKRGGARSWISILGFSIQPSEFMKISIILLYAKYLKDNYEDVKRFSSFLKLLSIAIIVFLIIMLQPDFGTGLVIIASCLMLLFISGTPYKYLLLIFVVGLIGISLLIIFSPYRIQRILAFLDPWSDPLGSGFQGIQSLFAIAPGGILGHGFNQSIQKHFFLPEPQNDFIFAIILEEFGLIGGAVVLTLYFIIIYRGVKISLNVNDNFLKFTSIGIILSLGIQVVINVGVVTSILPVTGITLPLFSYGGSSLLLTITSLSILLSISKYQNI